MERLKKALGELKVKREQDEPADKRAKSIGSDLLRQARKLVAAKTTKEVQQVHDAVESLYNQLKNFI